MSEPRIGPYQLEAKIGAGAMGAVYRGRHIETGEIAAVKVLPAEFSDNERSVARFEREIEILKRLQHPHIVRCFGGGQHGSRRYFAMELVEGGSLAALLRRRERLSFDQAIEYALQVCSALDHAHQHSIIHRDLKPSNLLLTRDGQVKLADFGLARDVEAASLTATGRTLGTFAYMSPEQICGTPPLSYKSDLYALGCVLFEMLTGRPPFDGESPAQVFYKHLNQPAPRVATIALDCPVWLDTAVAQLLEKDPQRRPLDAIAVSQTLREVQDKILGAVSAVQQAVSGTPSMLSVETDTRDLRRALESKKPRRKKRQPFYEQAWFLAGCLALIAGFVTWVFWPLSERKLYEKADRLMASSDPVQWQIAYEKYLEPMRQRFPDGTYAGAVQEHIDRYEMYRTEAAFNRNAKAGRAPQTEAERLYAAAWRYEKFGDRISALEKYQSMIELLKERPGDRPWVNLARRQAAQIEQSGTDQVDRIQIVNDALERADQLYTDGNALEARNIWNSIIKLYAANREMAPQVKLASSRLAGEQDPSP